MGIVAFFFLVPFAAGQRAVSAKAVDEAIQRGVAYIESREEKGSWGGGGASVGKDSLALYTLLKAGTPKEDERVLRVVDKLIDAYVKGTYEAAAMIMALQEQDGLAHRLRIEELAALLVSWQKKGVWGYPQGADLSNTQYAVLGLWAATKARVDIPPQVWFDLAPGVLAWANEDGGFRYKGSAGASTGSMTAAALTVLGLVDSLAPKRRPWTGAEKRELAEVQEQGMAWLDSEFRVDRNPGADEWHMYYLYSLERLGAIRGVSRFGEHSWYDEGAELLLKRQSADGSWDLGLAPTCFAVLFLTRATRSFTGEGAKEAVRMGVEDPESPVRLIAKGDTPLSMWVTGWNEEKLGAYVWPGEEGRGPRVVKVEYMHGDEVLQTVSASSADPAGEERFAVQHRFELPGSYQLHMRAHLLPYTLSESGTPTPGEVETIDSPKFKVSVFGAWPKWFKEQNGDPMRNLMPAERWTEVSASSVQLGGGDLPNQTFGGERAIDRRSGTAWIAEVSDESPTLVIDFDSPVEADRILLSHAFLTRVPEGVLGQAAIAHVRLNEDRRAKKLKLNPETRRKTVYDLGRTKELTRIEIILERGKNSGDLPIGLSEVEIQQRR